MIKKTKITFLENAYLSDDLLRFGQYQARAIDETGKECLAYWNIITDNADDCDE